VRGRGGFRAHGAAAARRPGGRGRRHRVHDCRGRSVAQCRSARRAPPRDPIEAPDSRGADRWQGREPECQGWGLTGLGRVSVDGTRGDCHGIEAIDPGRRFEGRTYLHRRPSEHPEAHARRGHPVPPSAPARCRARRCPTEATHGTRCRGRRGSSGGPRRRPPCSGSRSSAPDAAPEVARPAACLTFSPTAHAPANPCAVKTGPTVWRSSRLRDAPEMARSQQALRAEFMRSCAAPSWVILRKPRA